MILITMIRYSLLFQHVGDVRHSWFFLSQRISVPKLDLVLQAVILVEECQQFPLLHDSIVTVLFRLAHTLQFSVNNSQHILYIQYNKQIICFIPFGKSQRSIIFIVELVDPGSPLQQDLDNFLPPTTHCHVKNIFTLGLKSAGYLHREVVWRIYQQVSSYLAFQLCQ